MVLFTQILKSAADSSYADTLIDHLEDQIDKSIFNVSLQNQSLSNSLLHSSHQQHGPIVAATKAQEVDFDTIIQSRNNEIAELMMDGQVDDFH